MSEKPYHDIPGTILFDAEQSRKGYHLNMFCMSLMKAENREAFKADQRAYLDRWPMTEAQNQSVLDRHVGPPRQHLFHRQARSDRRALVPTGRRHDEPCHPT